MTARDWKTYGETAWTLAYRNPRANSFKRIDLALSWQEARDLSARLTVTGKEVWYTSNRRAEIDGYTSTEDAGNILADSGKRVRIFDTGNLADLGLTVADLPTHGDLAETPAPPAETAADGRTPGPSMPRTHGRFMTRGERDRRAARRRVARSSRRANRR